MAPFGRIYRFADFLSRHSRKLLYAFGACLLGAIGIIIWHELPVWRFSAKFAPASSGYHGATGIEFSRGLESGPAGAVLVIQQYRSLYFEPPRIQLRLAQRINLGPGSWKRSYVYHQDGIPRIVCDLNPEQTRYVMDHDIPEGLIKALVAAAYEADWMPMPTSQPWPEDKADVVVLPDAYFPDAQSD